MLKHDAAVCQIDNRFNAYCILMHYTWIFTSIYLYFFFAHWTCPTCNKRYQMVLMSPPLLTLTLFAAARATRRPRSRGRSAPSSRTWCGPSSSGSCATATTPTPPRYARGMFGVIRRLRCEDYRLFLSQNLILSQNHVLVSHASVFFSHFFKASLHLKDFLMMQYWFFTDVCKYAVWHILRLLLI